jgi:hypothetical protein
VRRESSVTSVSWIPSEAISGLLKMPFEMGVMHYDEPPPDQLDDLGSLQAASRFRFANEMRAWIDVVDGEIVDAGFSGGGRMGITRVDVAGMEMSIQAVAYPDIRHEPEQGDGWVRFVQTAGGRVGLPAPRRVNGAALMKFEAPTVWTTLALTLHADGRVEHEVVGASPFPRHWIYDDGGTLVAKVGLLDFKGWYRKAYGKRTPWGEQDSPALVTAVESALERELSHLVMHGDWKPLVKKVRKGGVLVKQGESGHDVYLLLDGVVTAEVDGKVVAEIGPGAVLGERALFEDGKRTATLRASTKCRVAAVPAERIDRDRLERLTHEHRREHTTA